MGTWSAGINGNDTAEDLRSDYTCAFYYYDIDEAVKHIDDYVRREICDESDSEEWCNYVYSLADFMWKKGILTDEIRDRAIGMIDSEFGLGIWAESGEKMLRERKKVLHKFKLQLLSPLPKRKKIKPNVHMEQIFENGDIIAIRLLTKNKAYASWASLIKDLSAKKFQSYDGKYILIQKIRCYSSWQCSVVPEINDYWAVFRLFDGVYDEIPKIVDMKELQDAAIISSNRIYSLFACESSMFYFKRRKYKIIGHSEDNIKNYEKQPSADIFLGVSNDAWDPDSLFLAAMDKSVCIEKYSGTTEKLLEIAYKSNCYQAFEYNLTSAENNKNRCEEERIIYSNINQAISDGADFYTISYGKVCGIASVLCKKIDNVYILGHFQRLGLGTKLLSYLSGLIKEGAYTDIPNNNRNKKQIMHICEKIGINANIS